MTEQWLPAAGYEGYYEVSDAGQVRSLGCEWEMVGRRGAKRMGRKTARMLKIRLNMSGYPCVELSRDTCAKDWTVHRLVLMAFVGRPAPGLECRHLDGDRGNAKLSNLRWGTPQENAQDKIAHGTTAAGERNCKAKLTGELAGWIRDSRQGALDIARVLCIHQSTVNRVRCGASWA